VPAEHAVDWRQVRTILSARWRILFKGLARKPWMLLLTAVGTLAWAAFVALLTLGAGFGMAYVRSQPELDPYAAPALHAAFLFVLVSLAVSPALGLRGNEFLDVTKLFVFPVSHRTVFAATLLGLATSNSVLFLTLPLAAAVVGYGGGVAAVAGGVAAALLTAFVGVAVGQTGLLLFLDVFRSRRWRDLSRLVLALLSAGIYAAMRFTSGSAAGGGARAVLETFDRWKDWTLPLPSWWGAHAVTGAGWVRWLPALALPVALAWLVRVAAHLQERAYFGEIEERRESVAGSRGGIAGWVGRTVPGALGAAAEKDLRILFRDPTVRIQLIQQFAYAIVPLVAAFWSGRGGRGGGDGVAEFAYVGVAYLPLLLTLGLVMNPLGTEGTGIQHALLTPVARSTFLAGKMVALCVVLGGAAAVLSCAATTGLAVFVAHAGAAEVVRRAALGAVESLAAFAVFAGVGAVTGAAFPARVVSRDRRALKQTSSGRRGCVGTLAGFAALLVGMALCAPVAVAFHHPALARLAERDSTPLLALTVPLAVAWGGLVAWAGCRVGGTLLVSREEEASSDLTRSEE
jgi:hypothetical protein